MPPMPESRGEVMAAPALDSYWQPPVPGQKRHRKCKRRVACACRFECTSPDHRGNRPMPWCDGAADDYPEYCSACWSRAMKREGKL